MGIRRRKPKVQKDRIYLGKISKPHGLAGEVKFIPFQCNPWLLEILGTVHNEKNDRTLEVEHVRGSEKSPIVKFKTIENRNDSEKLAGSIIWVHESVLPELEEDFYYESDFLFSQVVSVSGEYLGKIEDIIETSECDVLVIRDTKGNEIMLPASLEVVKEIRKEDSTIVVEPLQETTT